MSTNQIWQKFCYFDRKTQRTLGYCSEPKVGWQKDFDLCTTDAAQGIEKAQEMLARFAAWRLTR